MLRDIVEYRERARIARGRGLDDMICDGEEAGFHEAAVPPPDTRLTKMTLLGTSAATETPPCRTAGT